MTETVRVASYRTRLEAELAARLLDGLDIPYVINSPEGMAHGPFAPGATILVRAGDADLAREALQAVDDAADVRDAERHVVRLGPAVSENDARAMSDALRGAGIQVFTRSESDGASEPGSVTLFVPRNQADDARRVLGRMRREER